MCSMQVALSLRFTKTHLPHAKAEDVKWQSRGDVESGDKEALYI